LSQEDPLKFKALVMDTVQRKCPCYVFTYVQKHIYKFVVHGIVYRTLLAANCARMGIQ